MRIPIAALTLLRKTPKSRHGIRQIADCVTDRILPSPRASNMSQARIRPFRREPAARRNPIARALPGTVGVPPAPCNRHVDQPQRRFLGHSRVLEQRPPTSTSDVVIGDLNAGPLSRSARSRVDPQHYGERSGRHFRRQPHCSRRFNNERRTDHDRRNTRGERRWRHVDSERRPVGRSANLYAYGGTRSQCPV